MRKRTWPSPIKRRGQRMPMLATKLPESFLRALRAYSAEESQRTGTTVSQGIILMTLALEADARLRRIHEQLRS